MQVVFDLEAHKKRADDWFEAIIFPDGRIHYAIPSHIGQMIAYTKEGHDAIYEKMPIYAAPLEWMIAYTGCVAVWDGGYMGRAKTDAQKAAFEMLMREGLVKNKVFR